ncbi:hypothetical protein [Brachybacterium nesterenkovii]|uniref:hypothetical protein n=1 Tax=Brachybacterium nesterenkovii TaxID=47847 RepID=UPI00321B07C3
MTMPDDDPDMMWTAEGRERYLEGVEVLVEQLRRHARLVAGLDREHFDHDPDTRRTYWTSQDLVHRAIADANDRELDWAGAMSLPAVEVDADGEDAGDIELIDLEDEAVRPRGDVLSLVGRWDVDIVDPERFLAAGRAAYTRRHGLEDPVFAEVSVTDPLEAAAALLESPTWPELEVPGASVALGAYWQYVQHDEPLADLDDPEDGDPFDIVSGD